MGEVDSDDGSCCVVLMVVVGFLLINLYFWLDMMVIGLIVENFGNVCMVFVVGVVIVSCLWLIVQGLGVCMLVLLFIKFSIWCVFDGIIVVIFSILVFMLVVCGVY